jgi:hypothetical protein
MKEAFIILIPVTFNNSRKLCEQFENEVFNIPKFPDSLTTAKKIKEVIGLIDELVVLPISDFMDMVNVDDIDFSQYFITYVYSQN